MKHRRRNPEPLLVVKTTMRVFHVISALMVILLLTMAWVTIYLQLEFGWQELGATLPAVGAIVLGWFGHHLLGYTVVRVERTRVVVHLGAILEWIFPLEEIVEVKASPTRWGSLTSTFVPPLAHRPNGQLFTRVQRLGVGFQGLYLVLANGKYYRVAVRNGAVVEAMIRQAQARHLGLLEGKWSTPSQPPRGTS